MHRSVSTSKWSTHRRKRISWELARQAWYEVAGEGEVATLAVGESEELSGDWLEGDSSTNSLETRSLRDGLLGTSWRADPSGPLETVKEASIETVTYSTPTPRASLEQVPQPLLCQESLQGVYF